MRTSPSLHDRTKLGVTEGVPAEFASRWQERHEPAGAVASVCQLAVRLGNSE